MKKANAPVQLIYDYYTKGVYAVNETLEPANVKAEMKLLKDGQTINNSQQIEIASGTVVKVFDIDTSGAPAAFLFLKLTDGKGNEVATNEYFLPSGNDTYDWSKTTWVNTPITQYASYDMLDGLCTKDCELTIKPSSEGLYKITVSNPTDKVAFMIRLVAKNRNGELICPAYWSDNYFSLAPGDSRTITCQTSSQRATIQVDMYDE